MSAPERGKDAKAEALSKVLTNPDDDAPRHEFASLITEKEPRLAEFIEAQLKVAELNSDTSIGECLDAYLTSSGLLESHYDIWRPLWQRSVDVGVEEYEFYRGFVELVQVSGSLFIDAGQQLFEAAPVRHLDLNSTTGLWDELRNDPGFARIRSISLNNNELTNQDVRSLSESPFLQELTWLTLINNAKVSEDGIEALAANFKTNLPKLRYVSFAGTRFNPVERYAADDDVITSTWLPEIGEKLEREFGPLPWLRIHARLRSQLPPLRFSFEGIASLAENHRFNNGTLDPTPAGLAEVQ
jgi:hypothetical protein